MSWNYRVIRKSFVLGSPVHVYQVHEVYYRSDGSIKCSTVEPVAPYGETVEELLEEIERFKLAANKPILEEIDGKLVEVK